jgi:hypothetical protein
MKNFRVIYLPLYHSEKRWRFFEANSIKEVENNFKYGTILRIEETDEEFEEID